MREDYADQVALLVRVLPTVAKEETFALKGGTAINLFYRDMPRLSVDIDLTYLPTTPWEESLKGIDDALDRILQGIQNDQPALKVGRMKGGSANETRILVENETARIKIETAPPARGIIHPSKQMVVQASVEEQFGFAEMTVLSFEDLFAGKLVAALDRQHPRDLFDVKLLYENEGLSDDLFRTLLAYISFSKRPPHELLNPNRRELAEPFEKEFEGMSSEPASLSELEECREHLLNDVRAKLDDSAKRFLLSLHDAAADFGAIGLDHVAEMPAVVWKLHNLQKLKDNNPTKHTRQRELIEALF